jgi:two-component system sensor histidine kinase CpxA
LADGRLAARVDHQLLRRHDEIGYLGNDFNLMASRIESLVDAQRRLLADISHELRSPLARQGVALGLARRRAGPEATTALDRIEREAARLNELIGQLLTLSLVESGAGVLEKVRIDLAALMREIVDDADFEARSRDRSVRITSSIDVTIEGVPSLVRSAVENVLRNGVRYTGAGTEVEVSLSSELSGTQPYVLIAVRDHGKGVPDEEIDEIFRPFYRIEDARDRKTGGVGLGLSIAARAIHLHAGTIRAANAPDGGLVVEIRLPAEGTVNDTEKV